MKENYSKIVWIGLAVCLVFLFVILGSLTIGIIPRNSKIETNKISTKPVFVEALSGINNYIASSQTKIIFFNDYPKLFLGTDNIPGSLKVSNGSVNLSDNEVVLGYNEAQALKSQLAIGGVGDNIKDFFGLTNVKIIGILEPTDTLIDDYYLVNNSTLAKITSVATIKMVAEGKLMKIYYFTNNDNVPEKVKLDIGSLAPVKLNKNQYIPAYIGSAEARIMDEGRKVYKIGDIAENLFGNKVIVAGILSDTGTVLDKMHFVGPGFEIRN